MSLLHVIKNFEDGGVFQCGPANSDVGTWNCSINITIGKKPSRPQSLSCTGHLLEKASCTWTRGPVNTNLPVTYQAQEKSSLREWTNCSTSADNICDIGGNALHYSVQVREVNELGSSEFIKTEYNMNEDVRPLPPTDLTLNHSNESIILASWRVSDGWKEHSYYLEYQLQYRPISPGSSWRKVPDGRLLIEGEDINDYVIRDLEAYTTYEVQVRAKYHQASVAGKWSSSFTITTKEEYPFGQVDVMYEETDSEDNKETYRNILLKWEVPEEMKARGKILGFEIELYKNGVYLNTTKLNNGSITQYTYKNLLRDANYTVYISAFNSVASSTPAILNIPPSPLSIPPSAIIIAVAVSIAILVIFLLLGMVWIRIRKSEICLPLPDPNFSIFKWDQIPSARPYAEDEVFDEVKQRRAVPTKDELDKLLERLGDPTLKDTVFDLLLSKFSIDHDWQRIQQRRSRLLSNNTEISFLSVDDEEENLICSLDSMPKNTVMSNFMHLQRESLDKLGVHHSMPMLDKKYTKDDVNVKDESYTSDSGDTSGIGSESSDQDLENESQLMLRQSLPDVHCTSKVPEATLGKPKAVSQYTDFDGIPKVPQKSHNKATSLCTRPGYIAAKDVAKVVQSPHDCQRSCQRTTQPTVSEYLDAAQMHQWQTHQAKQKQLRHMQRKPKADNGYVDVKNMPKFVGHHSNILTQKMPKKSVYVQHRELPALLASVNQSSANSPSHPAVDSINENAIKPPSVKFKVTNEKQHEVKQKLISTEDTKMGPEVNNNQSVISKVSSYVKGDSNTCSGIKKPMRPSVRPSLKPCASEETIKTEKKSSEDNGMQNANEKIMNESVKLTVQDSVHRIINNIAYKSESGSTSMKSTPCTSPSNQPLTHYVTLSEVERINKNTKKAVMYNQRDPQSQASHLNYTKKAEQKLSSLPNGALPQRNVEDLQKRATVHPASKLTASGASGSQKINSRGLPVQNPASGTSGKQNISSSALSKVESPSRILGPQNLPKQNRPYVTSCSQNMKPLSRSAVQNVNGSGVPRQRPASGTPASQYISGSGMPKQSPIPKSSARCNANGSEMQRQGLPARSSVPQNISGSTLQGEKSLSGTSGPCNIHGSGLPKLSPPSGASAPQNISGSAVQKSSPKSGMSGPKNVNSSALPRQLNNSKANQQGGYIPILSLANSNTTASSPLVQPAKLPNRQTPVQSRSHFKNQGRMMKGQFKAAKIIYKVSPSL
ncbi:uncharacterized protein LOC117106292 isoform X2 [Anneissia japonica]|uniref:uncharacterized protein LOC117106292 isoform X2 n=1 Tax=Anneissia japonica TaxID=1529436 RepID=UPI001425755C|nr:uncharacterized protein LOC117106292 isoform X2 [Anneissia japonica]